MPTLSINADDFGLHPDMDAGIRACIERGRVTGTSVCANGPHIDWSVVRELARGPTQIGVHVTLVGERWLTQPRTFAKWTTLVPWLLLPGRRAMLEREVRAQIEAFLANSIHPSHLDSHQHVHVMTPIWDVCIALASEFGIERIRIPSAPDPRIAKGSIPGQILQKISLRRRVSAAVGTVRPGPPCIGIAHAGDNSAEIYAQELEWARGTTDGPAEADLELVAHPGFNTPGVQSTYAAWQFDWDAERDALLSNRFADACDRLGYVIGSV